MTRLPGRPPIDLTQEVETLGFLSEEDMLREFYIEQGFSLSMIERILGVDAFVIRCRLVRAGIPLRPRGGPNNSGNRKLIKVTDEVLYGRKAPLLAQAYNVAISTVLVERRIRERERAAAREALSGSTSTPIKLEATGEPVGNPPDDPEGEDGDICWVGEYSPRSVEELCRDAGVPSGGDGGPMEGGTE